MTNDKKEPRERDDLRPNIIDGHITSEALAGFIIESLLSAKIIKEKDFEKAIKIAIEEIDVIKAMNAY